MDTVKAEDPPQQDLNDSGCVQDASVNENTYRGQAHLLDLSDDVLLCILRFCSPMELKALGHTCPRLGALVCDRTLWTKVDARSTPVGEERLKWLLTHCLSNNTTELKLSGYVNKNTTCLGIQELNFPSGADNGELRGTRVATAGGVEVEHFLLRMWYPHLPRYAVCPRWPDREEAQKTLQAKAAVKAENDRKIAAEKAEREKDMTPTQKAEQEKIEAKKEEQKKQQEENSKKKQGSSSKKKDILSMTEDDLAKFSDDEVEPCHGPQFTMTANLMKNLKNKCSGLTSLSLEYCNIDYKATNLRGYPPQLKKLSLRGTRVYNLPLNTSYLCKIQERLPDLEYLDVSECDWFEPASLMPLSKVPHLRELYMRECKRLTECVAYTSLATRYGFRELKIIDIRGSPLADAEVSALGWLPALEELYCAPPEDFKNFSEHSHKLTDTLPTFQELNQWELQMPDYYKNNPGLDIVDDDVPAQEEETPPAPTDRNEEASRWWAGERRIIVIQPNGGNRDDRQNNQNRQPHDIVIRLQEFREFGVGPDGPNDPNRPENPQMGAQEPQNRPEDAPQENINAANQAENIQENANLEQIDDNGNPIEDRNDPNPVPEMDRNGVNNDPNDGNGNRPRDEVVVEYHINGGNVNVIPEVEGMQEGDQGGVMDEDGDFVRIHQVNLDRRVRSVEVMPAGGAPPFRVEFASGSKRRRRHNRDQPKRRRLDEPGPSNEPPASYPPMPDHNYQAIPKNQDKAPHSRTEPVPGPSRETLEEVTRFCECMLGRDNPQQEIPPPPVQVPQGQESPDVQMVPGHDEPMKFQSKTLPSVPDVTNEKAQAESESQKILWQAMSKGIWSKEPKPSPPLQERPPTPPVGPSRDQEVPSLPGENSEMEVDPTPTDTKEATGVANETPVETKEPQPSTSTQDETSTSSNSQPEGPKDSPLSGPNNEPSQPKDGTPTQPNNPSGSIKPPSGADNSPTSSEPQAGPSNRPDPARPQNRAARPPRPVPDVLPGEIYHRFFDALNRVPFNRSNRAVIITRERSSDARREERRRERRQERRDRAARPNDDPNGGRQDPVPNRGRPRAEPQARPNVAQDPNVRARRPPIVQFQDDVMHVDIENYDLHGPRVNMGYSLISDSAILRFGRAENDNVNYVHIGRNGVQVGYEPGMRPDRSNLRVLSVTGYRNITNRSLEHLASAAPFLRTLDFTETNVTPEGVEIFKVHRPTCEVIFSKFGGN